ncbi:MAG TPA: DCC1-like thiol-disulfide oxidoreductase family protein [Actinomycetota bacterium]
MSHPVVFYDDDCGFCRWSASRLRVWDRRGALTFSPIQGSEGDRHLGDLDPDRRYASWHIVRDGRVWSSGAALTEVLRHLPGGTRLSAFTSAFPDLTERAYRLVARHRGTLGHALGQRACSVDPGASPTRT